MYMCVSDQHNSKTNYSRNVKFGIQHFYHIQILSYHIYHIIYSIIYKALFVPWEFWNEVGKIYIIIWSFFKCCGLDGVSNEAEDGSYPEEQSKSTKEVLAKLHPFGSLFRRSEGIWSVSSIHFTGFTSRKTLERYGE